LAKIRPIVAIVQKNDFSSYTLQFDYNTELQLYTTIQNYNIEYTLQLYVQL